MSPLQDNLSQRNTELEGMDELYHLRSDRYKMKNLMNDPKQAARLKAMQTELARMLKNTQ